MDLTGTHLYLDVGSVCPFKPVEHKMLVAGELEDGNNGKGTNLQSRFNSFIQRLKTNPQRISIKRNKQKHGSSQF